MLLFKLLKKEVQEHLLIYQEVLMDLVQVFLNLVLFKILKKNHLKTFNRSNFKMIKKVNLLMNLQTKTLK